MAATKGMDAASYLKKQGWKGDGHSLDPTSRGIKKPLLVSKKVDVLGVGLNKHAAVSDQWWMRAFDQGLKDLGTGKTNALTNIREHGMFAGGLYGRFVKGEGVAGTFAEDALLKRKREDEETDQVKRVKATSEHEEALRLNKGVDQQVAAFVAEAQKRGILPVGDKKPTRSAISPVASYGEAAVQQVFKQAGLAIEKASTTGSTKKEKYDREKLSRQLKRAARSFVIFQLSNVERKQIEAYEVAMKQELKAERKAKGADKAAREAEKAAAKEAKVLRKKEKRQAKLAAREESKDSAYSTDEAKEDISPAKLAKYEAKAAAKGISVEQYVRERESKKAAKVSQETITSSEPAPMFFVDTDGDTALATSNPELSSADRVIDAEGKIRYTVVPEIPVPLDPKIWEGVNVKTLPKAVREARRQWMDKNREARKAAKSGVSKKVKDKSKGEKKMERIEKLLIKILVQSRKAGGTGVATIDGIEAVPLVKTTTTDGAFSKDEMSLARTAARRALKNQKRGEESHGKKKGRSKGRNSKE